jgi:hypothetical protein
LVGYKTADFQKNLVLNNSLMLNPITSRKNAEEEEEEEEDKPYEVTLTSPLTTSKSGLENPECEFLRMVKKQVEGIG